VVAATNRIDLVDQAILRSGRFDIKVHIPLPDTSDRVGIFKKIMQRKLKDLNEVDETMINFIGEHSQGWCGADL
jgi:ATP-dependent 26S proteasome regulatory subunit